MGHKNDFTLTAGDLGGSEPSSEESVPKTREKVEAPSSTTVDMGQLEVMIDQALDRKLEPVIKLIRNTRKEGPGLTEIIGGIGYILGLFGLVMYFRNRKKGTRHKAQGARQNEKGVITSYSIHYTKLYDKWDKKKNKTKYKRKQQ